MSQEEKNVPVEQQRLEKEQIEDMGSVYRTRGAHAIHCLTVIGQVEGHVEAPQGQKTTKYEHVIPQLVAVQEDPANPVETLTIDAPYYAYQAAVCPDAARVASHQVIEEHIGTSGKDYRFEEKPHPVEALRDRTQDNTTIARGKI